MLSWRRRLRPSREGATLRHGRAHAVTALQGRKADARRDIPHGRTNPAPTAGHRSERCPALGDAQGLDHGRVACEHAEPEATNAGDRRPCQQDGTHHLGIDGERRDLSGFGCGRVVPGGHERVRRSNGEYGATRRSQRSAATRVSVRQWPGRAKPRRRLPLGSQPRSGAMLVLPQVLNEDQPSRIEASLAQSPRSLPRSGFVRSAVRITRAPCWEGASGIRLEKRRAHRRPGPRAITLPV